jgi:hypothetical protein
VIPNGHTGRNEAASAARAHAGTRTESRWSSYYVVSMNRTWSAGVCLLIGGVTALGCGGTNSAAGGQATTTTISGRQAGTALVWLSSIAEPWNHKLNGDQQSIDTASAASAGSSGTAAANTYFARLGTACSKMVDDAGQAQNIARAPSAALDQAWRTMVVQTKKYATDCVTLTRSHSNADLSTWNNSLKSMNTANAAFNAQVAVVHPPAPAAAG